MTITHSFRKVLLLLIVILMGFPAAAQIVTLCQNEDFDIYAYFTTELAACSPTATLAITSATAGGVSIGVPPSSLTITSDGFISVNILNGATVCASTSVQVDVIEANFTATAVQGSCHLVNIVGPQNEPGCTYTYTIGENIYTGSDLPNFAFANGGLQSIRLDVSCGGCTASQNITVDVDGPIAGLNFASSEVIYYDDNFESLVVCTDLAASDLIISDISQALTGSGTTGSLEILAPDNSIFNQNPYPDPITISLNQEGQYVFTYTLIDDGCVSTVSYDIFVSNPNVSTDLEVPVTVTPFTCEDTSYDVNVCPNGCPTNPSGTVYTVELNCTGFIYQTTEVPFTISVPLSVASCGETCTSGGTTTFCACELIVRAARPCVNEISNAICPFQIQPQPDAEFEILPNTANNTYCIGEPLTFLPEWDNIDCNGPNPTPSICEIQNPQWSVTPATGFVNTSGNLQTYPLNLQFTSPGNYTVCFEWQNACGSDSYCRTICILDDNPPVVDWNNVPIICVGDPVAPEVAFNAGACANPEIDWSAASAEVSFNDNTSENPSVNFSSPGNYTIDLDINGLCQPFSESANYTVCATPIITISNANPTLCVGQEFCFDDLALVNWNNCPGDVVWTIPGVVGSPFTNPSPAQLCLAFNSAQNFNITIEATNTCGTDTETISVSIDESPSCTIVEPGDFCPGEIVTIQPPLGAINPVWYASADGLNFTILAGGMPDSPSGSTHYYVESQVNGCFCISDTVVANFFTEPALTLNATNINPCPGEEVNFQITPPQSDVNWYNGTTLIATQPDLVLTITESVTITAEIIYGSATTACTFSEMITVNPITNPVSIGCSSLPAVWCLGGAASPLPSVSPVGGLAYITDGMNIVATNPSAIDPDALGIGDFYFVYQVTNWESSNCTFSDSCAFSIIEPQLPNIISVADSLCYNETLQLTENNGLNGIWSSSCLGAIDQEGLFSPQAAGCTPGSTISIYYSGECILNDTLAIYVIPIPSATITMPVVAICTNDCLDLEATIAGNYDEAIWNLSWTGGMAIIPFGGSFCPEDEGITTGLQVTAELSVSVNQNPICRITETITLNTIGIPEEAFLLDSPQCIAAGVSLPECENCDDYNITFENLAGSTFECAVPGDGCMLPDTGMYNYEMSYNFGFCSSNVLTGSLHIIDAPFLEITHLNYDSCAPVAFYELNYGGFDHSVVWETDGDLTNIGNVGDNLYTATINHISNIQVDAIYTDEITVTNTCGWVSDSRTVYHKALPDFTLDPDSTFYCDGQSVPVDIGFAQPLDVDSIVLSYFYQTNEEIVLHNIPQELLYFNFDSEFDTLEVNFAVTAYNPCGAITKTLTAFVLPTDVSADMDIPLTMPVCVGDTILIAINSSGNTNDETRQITTSTPFLEVFHTLGKWYLIPQEGITDGVYEVKLTELGLCGADMDTENFTFGPSLSANFQANNACIGNPVIFTPLISQEANLTWTFAPDTSRNTDFPPPYFYQRPGVYFPTLFAEAEEFCSNLYTGQVEIFEPRIPILTCAPDCGGNQGCTVNANNSSICVTVAESDKFSSYEWRVHGRFSPYYGQTVRIDVDTELEPCGNNLVTLFARDLRGCESKVSKQIDFNDDLIYIPNSFTPNEDGFNDLFKPVIDSRISSDLYELSIFNRWGELVFQTSDPDQAWNGNDISSPNHYSEAAVYTYMMKYKSCRNPNESDPQILRGIVTLIR